MTATITRARPVFRDGAVLTWTFASGVSLLGDVAFYASLAYAAAPLGSPALAAAVLAGAATPQAVLMLLGGAVTDRVDARKLMIASDIGCAAVLGAAVVAIDMFGLSAGILLA